MKYTTAVIRSLGVLVSIAAFGADKEPAKFQFQPAESYDSKQTVSGVTIAAVPFETESQARTAFGKLNPNAHGILPLLVVVQNTTKGAISLERMSVEYVTRGGDHVEATPAADLRFLGGANRPGVVVDPAGRPRLGRAKKNPLDAWELSGRSFSARMLPPGESAGGFFYFQTGHTSKSQLYVKGLREAATGKELFFFEVPLPDVLK